MKQFITKEQIKELKPKELGILAAFLDLDINAEDDYVELPSIRQMIEFLGPKDLTSICNGVVSLMGLPPAMQFRKYKQGCDNLWEAVKYKLRKK